ncbi:oligopeptide transporter 4, partial [Podila clonocystis]
MDKEEVSLDKFDPEKVERHDVEGQLELNEEDDSPIEEVRVTVPNNDDPSIPCNTFRMWFLGLLFTGIISFVNQFFYM